MFLAASSRGPLQNLALNPLANRFGLLRVLKQRLRVRLPIGARIEQLEKGVLTNHLYLQHPELRIDTGLQVFFCDPQSPWQRGTNKNTNRLLRQYFSKGTDLRRHRACDLEAVATTLNSRPRTTLNWNTPAEAFNELLLSLR